MHGLLVIVSLLVMPAQLAAAPANDRAACATTMGDQAIAACTRVITSGKLKGGDLAVAYRRRCVAWNFKRDSDRALPDCDEAIRLDPNNALAFGARCWAWNNKNEHDRALPDCNEAIRLDPKYGGAYNNRGFAWAGKREFDRAIADYDEAIRLNAKNSVAYVNRGDTWASKLNYDRAIADFTEATRLNPNSFSAFNQRGNTWRQKGEYDRAIADLDQAIRIDPTSPFARNNRGLAWAEKRDYHRAIADFTEAIRLDPGYPAAFSNRALSFERKGDRDRAQADFQAALAMPQKYLSGKWAHDTARDRLAALATVPLPSPAQPVVVIPPAPAQPSTPEQQSNAAIPDASPTPTGLSPSSDPGRRVALVIGNADYPDADPPLVHPRNDARLLAEELMRSGFEVELAENLTKQQLNDVTDRFKKKVAPGTAALLYYGGYGIRSGRDNYMIPVNAQIWTERDVTRDGVSIESVLAGMTDNGAAVKLVIIDASRRNPFERRFRSAAGGLAPIVAPANTLVISSAGLSQVLNEGAGKNSLFMTELLKEFRTPVVALEEVFSRARIGVSRATDAEQVPWVSSTLMQSISFKPTEERQRAR